MYGLYISFQKMQIRIELDGKIRRKEVSTMRTRLAIKDEAKTKFKAQTGLSIGVMIIFMLLSGAATGTFVGALLLAPPLAVGYSFFCLRVFRGETAEMGDLFQGFQNFSRNVGGMLWMYLFIVLWSMLFWIPGIIKALSYSMTPYILAECPNVKAKQALLLSMRMTKGHKGEIFVMGLSFIGWMILSSMTAGILYIVYVGPYMNTSFAGMYEELKKNALANGSVKSEELA
jgi:uncharacterized membrane protein